MRNQTTNGKFSKWAIILAVAAATTAGCAGGPLTTREKGAGIGAVGGEHGPVVAAAALVPASPHVDLVRLAVMMAEIGQVDGLAHSVPPR